jgi:carbamoyl-phosphate synthase large subunit
VRPLNFLVSSAGRRGELVAILRKTLADLGREGEVFCIDRSPLSAAGHLSDGFDLVPSVDDPTFISALREVCLRREVTHVIPTIDTELAVLAAHRHEFSEQGVHVWVSEPATVAIAQDKRRTHAWLSAHGFPTPRQLDLDHAIDEAQSGALSLPMIAKPSGGSSSIGLARVSTVTDLLALDADLDYVVEEVAVGAEHTVDVWVDASGRCRCAVPRLRLETRAGEVSKGVTVRNEALISLASGVAEALPGAFGALNIQIFLDQSSGALNVIEVNARFGGGFPLTWAAGGKFPQWIVEDLAGESTTGDVDAWQEDLLMLRYDQGVYLPSPTA